MLHSPPAYFLQSNLSASIQKLLSYITLYCKMQLFKACWLEHIVHMSCPTRFHQILENLLVDRLSHAHSQVPVGRWLKKINTYFKNFRALLNAHSEGTWILFPCVNIFSLKEALTPNLILALKLSAYHYKGFLQPKIFYQNPKLNIINREKKKKSVMLFVIQILPFVAHNFRAACLLKTSLQI